MTPWLSHLPSSPEPSRLRSAGKFAGFAALAAVAGGLLFTAMPLVQAQVIQAPPRLLEQGQPFSFANLVEQVSPAVVTVLVDREQQMGGVVGIPELPENLPEPFRDFFERFGQPPGQNGAPPALRSQAMGSGFIVAADGYVVTNNHVVADADEISVALPDGREFDASVVGTDADTDVALLRIENVDDLPMVAFGDDRLLRVGDWVVAVGNPFGLGGTVTAGIVSSIGRDIGAGPYTDYIQIDAPINRGNSGGPLFDLSGRVVGMNTAIFSPTGGSVGIGFAIPTSTLQIVVEQLREDGTVERGWLGVQIQDLTPDLASSLGIEGEAGALVASVVPDSPASRAGFQAGDAVLAVDGTTVESSRDLTRRVANLAVGQSIDFTVARNGSRQELTATIARRDSEQVASINPQAAPKPSETNVSSLGLGLAPLTAAMRQQFNLDESVNGVLVATVEPNSEAAEKGIRPGDVIVSVGSTDVRSPTDVARGIAEARSAGRDNVLLLVADANGQRFVALSTEEG